LYRYNAKGRDLHAFDWRATADNSCGGEESMLLGIPELCAQHA
jgi:hypothetical protein